MHYGGCQSVRMVLSFRGNCIELRTQNITTKDTKEHEEFGRSYRRKRDHIVGKNIPAPVMLSEVGAHAT